MKEQNQEDASMNFSVIDKPESQLGNFDFSLHSLLEEGSLACRPQEQKPTDLPTTCQPTAQTFIVQRPRCKSPIKQRVTSREEQSCNFLKDLSRMEKELSFESQSYNMYEDNPSISLDNLHINKSKTLSNLKITNDTNKSISKDHYHNFNEYYGQLIIDFHVKNKTKTSSRAECKSPVNGLFVAVKGRKKSKCDNQIKLLCRQPTKASLTSKAAKEKLMKSNSKGLSPRKGRGNSKSQNHFKASPHVETMEEKVFSEYYGTEANFKSTTFEEKKKVACLRSRQKSVKSKLGLISPKAKLAKPKSKKQSLK